MVSVRKLLTRATGDLFVSLSLSLSFSCPSFMTQETRDEMERGMKRDGKSESPERMNSQVWLKKEGEEKYCKCEWKRRRSEGRKKKCDRVVIQNHRRGERGGGGWRKKIQNRSWLDGRKSKQNRRRRKFSFSGSVHWTFRSFRSCEFTESPFDSISKGSSRQ